MPIDTYVRVLEEIRSNKLERNAWSRALRLCQGDVVRARDEYVLRRVEDLEPKAPPVRPLHYVVLREAACVLVAVALLTGAFLVVRAVAGLVAG